MAESRGQWTGFSYPTLNLMMDGERRTQAEPTNWCHRSLGPCGWCLALTSALRFRSPRIYNADRRELLSLGVFACPELLHFLISIPSWSLWPYTGLTLV